MIKFEGLGVMLEWKYGLVASTKQVGKVMRITKWRHATIPQPNEAQLKVDMEEYTEHLKSIAYKGKRQKEYPEIGDQLDAIIKSISKIKDSGVNIGTDGTKLLSEIERIKTKYPKK